jgi:hypothetical protein
MKLCEQELEVDEWISFITDAAFLEEAAVRVKRSRAGVGVVRVGAN